MPATNFYCGDDEAAKATTRQLIVDVGLEPMDLGGLTARFLEPLTLVWFAASRAVGSRQIIKVLGGPVPYRRAPNDESRP